MEAAMLFDNATTIDGYDLTIRESLANQTEGLCVEIRLGVGGTEHSTVDDQEVGIRGRQTIVLIIDRTRHGELHQLIGLALHSAESLELFFHQLKVGILLIGRIVTTHI
jgi:hypothetical protein